MHNVVLFFFSPPNLRGRRHRGGGGPENHLRSTADSHRCRAPVNWIPARAGMGAYKELGNPLPEETVRLID